MRGRVALCLVAIIATAPAEAVDQRLVGNTLVCQSVGGRQDWRKLMYLYVTATHMFKQETIRSPQGNIDSGDSAKGTVFQWNKVYSGSAGDGTFRSRASKGVGTMSFETNYRVLNAFVDTPVMDVAQKGTAQFNGRTWTLTVEQRQSIPNGRAAVPFSRTSYRCRVKEGRHLL